MLKNMNETYTYRLEKTSAPRGLVPYPGSAPPALIKWVEIKEVKARKETASEIDGTIVYYKNPTFGQRVWIEAWAIGEANTPLFAIGQSLIIPGSSPPFLNIKWDFQWKLIGKDLPPIYKLHAIVGVELAYFIGRRETDARDLDL